MTETTLTYTEADLRRWQRERRAAEPPTVTFGPYEPTGYGYMTWEDRPSVLSALFGGHNWISITRERWGRKCHERWVDAEGRPMGRWWWVPEERYRPSGAPPLPQTCARDTMEDEMGYEAATRFIGHREAMLGFPLRDAASTADQTTEPRTD